MDNYKKIIKSRKVRALILRFLKFIPNKVMLKIQYKIKLKRWPNLKKPTRFTEKIQVYKLAYRNPMIKRCVDKYEVRSYVTEKGLSEILNQNYGVYNSFSEIDYSKLPDKFVLKTTTGGGGNNVLIYRDKTTFDINVAKHKIGNWKRKSSAREGGREWAYGGLKPRLIVEEYLENEQDPSAGISDYKFFCFHGEPKYLVVDANRFVDHKRNFYDIDWNYLDVYSDHGNMGDTIEKPKNFLKMLDVSRKLSEDFPFVRVDLYNINGVIKFGELTFYPWSGYFPLYPDDFDVVLGKHFKIGGF